MTQRTYASLRSISRIEWHDRWAQPK